MGDAPGDRQAAEVNGVLFDPIDPGQEDESWLRFFEGALPRFFAGTYAGDLMAEQVARFEKLLPEKTTLENRVRPRQNRKRLGLILRFGDLCHRFSP